MDNKDFFRASRARTERGYSTLEFSLETAIADQVINVPGTLFQLDKESSGICYVEGNVGQGTSRNLLLASPGFSMLNENGFADFRITAPAQPGKTLKIVIATGMTIKPGDPVQAGAAVLPVVSGGDARTWAGQAMIGASQAPPVALNNAHVQLWNPGMAPAVTKTVFCSKIIVTSGTTQWVTMSTTYLVAVTSLYAAGYSKRAAWSASQAQCRYQNNVGLLTGQACGLFLLGAADELVLEFDEPIALAGNTGLILMAGTVNTDLAATFEWFER